MTPKDSIGNSLFFLVYGIESILLQNLILPSPQLTQSIQYENCPTMENRINTLLKLEEDRERSKQHLIKHQQIVNTWFNRTSVSNRDL